MALAYRVQAGLKMLTQEHRSAIRLGEKAIALAEAAQAPAIVFAAHNTIGSAWLTLDYERGRQYLEGNLRATHAAGFETLAALVRASGLAALIATHNLDLAKRMDRRVTLKDGKVVELP